MIQGVLRRSMARPLAPNHCGHRPAVQADLIDPIQRAGGHSDQLVKAQDTVEGATQTRQGAADHRQKARFRPTGGKGRGQVGASHQNTRDPEQPKAINR